MDLVHLLHDTVKKERRFPTILKASRAQLDQWTQESDGVADFGHPPHLGIMLPHGVKYLIPIILIPDGSETVLISKETASLAGQTVRMDEGYLLIPDDLEGFDREAIFRALTQIKEDEDNE